MIISGINNRYGIRFPLDQFPTKLDLSDLLDLSQAKIASLGLSDPVDLDWRMHVFCFLVALLLFMFVGYRFGIDTYDKTCLYVFHYFVLVLELIFIILECIFVMDIDDIVPTSLAFVMKLSFEECTHQEHVVFPRNRNQEGKQKKNKKKKEQIKKKGIAIEEKEAGSAGLLTC